MDKHARSALDASGSSDSRGVIGEIGNNTAYAPWVQSQQFQAWMHRGRWVTDEQALQEEAPLLEAEAEQIVIRE